MLRELPLLSTPPTEQTFNHPGRWWRTENERIICDLCPRHCSLKPGDRGFCFVRQNLDGQMMLTTYGRSTGFCIDPIEKKPLNHFYPGSSVLSFGTAGCNLGCKFCQNWDISKSREIERLSERAGPEDIAGAAKELGCRSVAFTYNDPVIWAEYAIDTARACHDVGVKTVAVTAGYITKQARDEFYAVMDAANVDLKAFTEEFYQKLTLSHIEPVMETLRWLKAETNVWFEITNLVIPGANDSPDEFQRMCDWILAAVGDEVPVHFTAFHPDYRMMDRPHTPPATLNLARDIALKAGLKYVYNGNVNDAQRQSTWCPNCQRVVIERNWYDLGRYALQGNRCSHCGHTIPGHFDSQPGNWGRRRQPIDMRQFVGVPPSGGRTEEVPQGGTPTKDPVMTTATLQRPEPTSVQQRTLLAAAAEYVIATAIDRPPVIADPGLAGLGAEQVSGLYVSLKRQGKLRTCWGFFGREADVASSLKHIAVGAVTSDPRFPPISPCELPYLDLEVWLLFAPGEVAERGEARIKAVTVGRHGLQVARGDNRGLLLPGVPVENGWSASEFLDHVCLKANLPATAWREADTSLMRFEGLSCKRDLVQDEKEDWQFPLLYTDGELQTYVRFYADAIMALMRGAMAMPYCTTLPDYNISGASLVLRIPASNREISSHRLSMLRSIPLQTTLFSLCQELVREAARQHWHGFINAGQFQLDVAIAYDAAMHGTVAEPDLGGLTPAERSLLVSYRGNTGWVYDRALSADELRKKASELAGANKPHATQVFSFRTLSTRSPLLVRSAPQAVLGGEVRPAAVAGSFYPAEASQMNGMLDALLAEPAPRHRCAAIMVPHAGWRFSGKIAADVLKRVQFPKLVIALGPKHTPHGVEWSVAPHRTWQLPNGEVESDPVTARKLVRAIDGLQLDAAAHQQEHGVEVELPFIARLAPGTRVVGIAIGGGDLETCDQFAAGLAEVLRQFDERPLLLISSDMNHFADDAETRRLDRLAVAELERLSPDALYETTTRNHISMCGMLPAVIVLKTLQRLNALSEAKLIGYGTSADVSGDTSRVVGYAGMTFA